MDKNELSKLRELATKATQGDWVPFIGHKDVFAIGLKEKSDDQIIAWSGFDSSHEPKHKQKANCEFIAAANPKAIIDIVDSLESCNKEIEELRSGFWDVIFHTNIDIFIKRGFATYFRSADEHVVKNGGDSLMDLFNKTCINCGYLLLIKE